MRQGLAGFYGNHKTLINGFFRPSYTVAAAVTVPTVPGLEYTLSDSRLHYTLPDNKAHYDIPENRLHYTIREED